MTGGAARAGTLRRLAAKARGGARVLWALGPRTSAEVAASTVRTALDDAAARWQASARRRVAQTRTPGVLLEVRPLKVARRGPKGRLGRPGTIGASVRFSEADLEVRFLADDVVRVTWGPGEEPPGWALAGFDPLEGPPTPAVEPALGPAPVVRVTGDAAGVRVESAAVAVEVAQDGGVRFVWRGVEVRRELPPLRRGSTRTHRHLLRPGEKVGGLGEQSGPVDLSGSVRRLWNCDPAGAWGPGDDPLYCVIPVLVGMHPGGHVLAFFDNAHEGRAVLRRPGVVGPGTVELEFSGGLLRHYVAVGTLADVLGRYSALTGLAAMPARWALGYHQSRWGYRTQDEVHSVADGFATERLPLSAVHLDIDHLDGYRVFTADPVRFPDLPGLTAHLAERGTRAVAIVDPAVKADPTFDVFASGIEHFVRDRRGAVAYGAVWPGRAAFPDFTSPAARRWWAGHYGRLVDAGVGGVWHDMNEPTSLAWWGDRTLARRHRHDAEGAGADHRACHNAYGALMDHAGAAALARLAPDRRPFVLTRSGWAGVGRCAWHWTGDAESTWPSLRQQVATVVNLGLSGVPFSGPDVGGFAGSPDPELYLRWLELAVLMGLCRTHCITTAARREPWAFPEPARSAIGRLVRFRYRLLPHLYTLAHETATTGHPLVRPTSWAGGELSDDAFLLGGDLLAAPVLAPGERRRGVALPPGRWVPWKPLPDAEHEGPAAGAGTALEGRVEVAAPLGAPPMFVRSGAVLVLDDGWPADADPADGGALDRGHRPRRPALHCFPNAGGVAEGRWFDDAGDGGGPWRHERVRLDGGVLQREATGTWPAAERVAVVVHGLRAVAARADGRAVDVLVSDGTPAVTRVECGPFDRLELDLR